MVRYLHFSTTLIFNDRSLQLAVLVVEEPSAALIFYHKVNYEAVKIRVKFYEFLGLPRVWNYFNYDHHQDLGHASYV